MMDDLDILKRRNNMSNDSLHSFMKTSELYLRFTELKSSSFDINKIEPFIYSKKVIADDSKKIISNKSSI